MPRKEPITIPAIAPAEMAEELDESGQKTGNPVTLISLAIDPVSLKLHARIL